MLKRNPTVAFFTVATNKYLYYWERMFQSYIDKSFLNVDTHFHVFTDDSFRARGIVGKYENEFTHFHIHEIQNYIWPEATLLRYEIIANELKYIDCDVAIHIDADMLFVSNRFYDFLDVLGEPGIILVEHPGFYFKFKYLLRCHPLISIRYLLKYFKNVLLSGGFGSWESNKESTSYAPRKLRKTYYCGALWIGTKNKFLDLCTELALCTSEDLRRGIVAIHNDESHLNRWALNNIFHTLTPAYCYEESYRHLENLQPILLAVNKKKNEVENLD